MRVIRPVALSPTARRRPMLLAVSMLVTGVLAVELDAPCHHDAHRCGDRWRNSRPSRSALAPRGSSAYCARTDRGS